MPTEGTAAPAESAPETTAPSDGMPDATTAYERFDFPAPSDEPPAKEPPAAAPPPAEAATPKADEASAPKEPPAEGEDDIPDEEWERITRSKRFDRLVDNRYGNKLQQERDRIAAAEREKVQQEAAAWDQATETFNRLQDDESYREEMARTHGEPAVLRFQADYQDAFKQRQAAGQNVVPAAVRQQLQVEVTQSFNTDALGIFKDVTSKAAFFNDLPEDAKQVITNLAPGQENWLDAGFKALADGINARFDALTKQHQAALREATEAGKNDAIASRTEAAPVVINSQGQSVDPYDIIRRYAEGDTGVSRDQYRKALVVTGKDY